MQDQQESHSITTNKVIQSYKMLSNEDPEARYQANNFLCSLVHRDQAWQITQSMINTAQDNNFQFLGTQILYQKVSMQIQNLSSQVKNQLRQFVFQKLADNTIVFTPTIDKLASIAALIACVPNMQNWTKFIPDLIGFMGQYEHNLKSGLFVIQRVPQELRNTNRIGPAQKNATIDQILIHQKSLSDVFMSLLNHQNNLIIKKTLQAMESWAKSRFNFLKYTQLVKKVLMQSLLSQQKFETGTSMMIQTIKGASVNRLISSLSQWQPIEQLSKYKPQQIQSIKLIIQFIMQNKKNFLQSSDVQSQHIDMYLDIIKNSLLNFSFLITQSIGFQMLNIIKDITKSGDLRTSQGTFQFWMDFADKMAKCKVSQQIKNAFAKYIQQVFDIVSKKIIIQSQSLLDDPDLKEDVTIDDINAMSFSQYRRQSIILYQSIYSFFLAITKSPKHYFDKCFQFIGNEGVNKQTSSHLGRGTQLALFCIKASIQSMISPVDAQQICKLLNFIIDKGTQVYARIVVETLLLIRDCSKQIKSSSQLCIKALNYSLHFLTDQKICYYAVQAFKTLMQTVTNVGDPLIVSNMLQFYRKQTFPNQQIASKIVEGIFITIVKIKNQQAISHYLKQLISITLNKFQNIYGLVSKNNNSVDKPYLLPLKQIKTIMECFQAQGKQFENKHQQIYKNVLVSGLKMITIVFPYSFSQRQNYVKFNELGISCSIFRHCLNLDKKQILSQFLTILDQILAYVLNKQTIIDMYPLLQILCYTMIQFSPNKSQKLTSWLSTRISFINNFFLSFMEPINLADVDIIRIFFEIQQNVIIYNSQVFLKLNNYMQIFDLGLFVLRHINQKKMQRKLSVFLYLCSQMIQPFIAKFPKIIETILASIPITNSLSHHNLSRSFLTCAQYMHEHIKQIIYSALKSNPYEGLSENTVNLLVKLMLLTIDPSVNVSMNVRQRSFMMLIADLQDLVKHGEIPKCVTQLQFRYAVWKKNNGLNMANTSVQDT